MPNIATCPNGHNFDSNTYESCPYCPKNTGEDKTQILDQFDGAQKTQIISVDDESSQDSGTDRTSGYNLSSVPNSLYSSSPPANDGTTKIIHPDEPLKAQPTAERKLVGLLVSYDLRQKGSIYHLYEGKNLIGSDCRLSSICISSDPGISGKHLTILFRAGKFRFRDELSTNGTFVNGEDRGEGELLDKDELKLGNTRFVFLSIPLEHKY